jgi:RNA 3'-terminal phosphate cyclase (ATP)
VDEDTAAQPGAACAVFADTAGGVSLGSDRAGAPRRISEAVGQHAARVLIEDLSTGANVDRFTADQLIIFAALADGESSWRVPRVTDHVESGAWLVNELLGAGMVISGNEVVVRGVGFRPLT